MSLLDVRTVVISYGISNLICLIVTAFLWMQNRDRFAGLGFWLADFALQFTAQVLLGLRGLVPDVLSMTVSNAMVIGGTLLLLMGLERFTGKRTPQLINALLLAGFICGHAYLSFIRPSFAARQILFSLALMALCSQCAWLMLRRADPQSRSYTRGVGHVLIVFCLISAARIAVDLSVPLGDNFLRLNTYDTALLLTYQMLTVLLMVSLLLMVNRRLFGDLENDLAERRRMGEALKQSEEKFFKAFHASPDAVLISRLTDGRLIEVNDGFCRLTGYGRDEAMASTAAALGLWADPLDRDLVVAELRKNRSIREYELDFRTKDGGIRNCLYSAELIQIGGEGYILSVVRDITTRNRMEKTLRQSEELHRAIVQTAMDGFWLTDAEGSLLKVNEAYCRMSGYTEPELLTMGISDLEAVETADLTAAHIRKVMTEGQDRFATRHRRKDGRLFDVEISVQYRDGRFIAFLRDITASLRAEEITRLRLRLWEYASAHTVDELLQNALDEIGLLTDSPIGFYHFVEEDQNALSLQAWSTRTLTEFCKAEGKGRHYPISEAGVWVDCFHQRRPVIHNDYASLPHRKGLPEGHAVVMRELVVPTLREGRVMAILGVGNKPAAYDEKDAELVEYIADVVWTIVGQKRAEEQIRRLNGQLEHLAMTDELTGLANRRAFFSRGGEEVKRAQRYETPLSLIMLDIDGFKSVNDTHGHDAGDLILRCLAQKLQESIREIDMAARLGGEEFCILLPNTKSRDASKLAERLRRAVEQGRCSLHDKTMSVTVSVGVAEFSPGMANLDAVLKNADTAMYQAKALGRNRVVLWKEPAPGKKRPV